MTSRRHQIKLTAPTPIAEDHWTIQAACRGEDPNLFHIDGDSSWDNQRHATRRTICGQICAPCPVRSEWLRRSRKTTGTRSGVARHLRNVPD
jgi:hypothetical protein